MKPGSGADHAFVDALRDLLGLRPLHGGVRSGQPDPFEERALPRDRTVRHGRDEDNA